MNWLNFPTAAAVALLAGCGGTTPSTPPAADCSAPAELALSDIESVTDWINAMPKPLELPCFIASLPRPLAVNITQSTFSAQPANGRRNPRIFLFFDALTLSVVPQEAAKPDSTTAPDNLLEMSFRTDGINSIKAELAFPIRQNLSYGDAYTRLQREEEYTICALCHAAEVTVAAFDGVPVHQSQMLAPYPDARITLGFLLNENLFCDEVLEPHRCAMLRAIAGDGDIVWQAFPEEVPVL